MPLKLVLFIILIFCFLVPEAQNRTNTNFIYTKDGKPILNRWKLKASCLKGLNKDNTDKEALSICECQLNRLDGYFTAKEYRKFTKDRIVDLSGLINSNNVFKDSFSTCFTSTGKTILLQAEASTEGSIEACINSLKNSSNKNLDTNQVKNFCACQFELIKTKKLTDKEVEFINDPNSLLFFEIMFKCGDPFLDKKSETKGWTTNSDKDITGPSSDTINVLNMGGMTFVKKKIGSMIQFWLFDTGATDLLITKEMEETLKNENVITTGNYTGTKEYEMANGVVDTCRTYKLNGIRIGEFFLDNVTVAVSDKAKRIIAGKSLINKFSSWAINNKNNTLILNR